MWHCDLSLIVTEKCEGTVVPTSSVRDCNTACHFHILNVHVYVYTHTYPHIHILITLFSLEVRNIVQSTEEK